MLYLLDTDHISLLQRIGTYQQNLVLRLGQIAPDDYGVTIVSFEEQVSGRLSAINNATSASAVTQAYNQLNDTLQFFTRVIVLCALPRAFLTIVSGLLGYETIHKATHASSATPSTVTAPRYGAPKYHSGDAGCY